MLKIKAKKFVLVQLLLVSIGYILTLIFFDNAHASSFLIGGLATFLANFIFFCRFFINKKFSPSTEVMIFYLSEILKLSIIAIVTVVLAIVVKPKLFSYISGLILLQLAACFTPLLFKDS